ncbi:transporter [Clostridium tarantellae]|uniref:Transporter n=1 Tax=Clostridium tarantellae TaxID=39493 RepID=A0A6I1MMI3_9CLOT|nr:transporter [Clostridium tarantellae]MPQ43452.1 transporter [Clostridium tarantellae]
MKEITKIFQIAAVFVGTIVGAGLASGKEITQFFTIYGYKSFIGIILTGLFYIFICSIISKISIKHKLNSYSEVFSLVSPNLLGKITGIITTIYLISSASIILAGSGSLINQFFGVPKIAGTLIMALIAILILFRETDGLVEINSLIVPSLVIVITTLMIMYVLFSGNKLTFETIVNSEALQPKGWIISTILYAGYNTLCCCGVIVPLSCEINNRKTMIKGIAIGSLILTILCMFINSMLMVNQPNIFEYEIPLLYVADRFGKPIQIMLLTIILAEMFSTEVSDVYSISKTLNKSFRIKYKNAIFLVLFIALPISQIGFSTLISTLYPIFGVLSLVFIFQCVYFYYKKI